MSAWQPHPLRFEPILKPKVWGGRALERLGKQLPAGEFIGESWELADLPHSIASDGQSGVPDGPLKGMTLHEIMERHGSVIMGDAPTAPGGRFPLLIKLLDARENLSVQVHPSPGYAAQHRGAHLKSEAWVILEAKPQAMVYVGIKPGISPTTWLIMSAAARWWMICMPSPLVWVIATICPAAHAMRWAQALSSRRCKHQAIRPSACMTGAAHIAPCTSKKPCNASTSMEHRPTRRTTLRSSWTISARPC